VEVGPRGGSDDWGAVLIKLEGALVGRGNILLNSIAGNVLLDSIAGNVLLDSITGDILLNSITGRRAAPWRKPLAI